MKTIVLELRLLVAEYLILLALWIAPKTKTAWSPVPPEYDAIFAKNAEDILS